MKRLLFCTAILATLLTEGLGQELNCTQKLRTARGTYEQGRLHELPVLLEGCLKNGFSDTERIEAYRLLVLTYIYLEEPAKADAAMMSLLETDHFFKLNPLVDPVEFQSLYKKFRTNPIFSWGIKFGPTTNHVNVQKNYYIWGDSEGKGEYKAKVGIQFGVIFEKNLTNKPDNKLIANPEIFYNSYSTIYSNSSISTKDQPDDIATDGTEFTIKQNRINLNLMVQYKFAKGKLNETLSPYVSLGPSLYYLAGSTFGGDVTVSSQRTIPSFKTDENYKKIGVGVIASAGVKYKVGSFYLTADIRYMRGLHNVVKTSNRFKQTSVNQQLWDAGYIDNDFVISQSMINLGLIVPYFKPKKLIK
jgi:outer membrane protein W